VSRSVAPFSGLALVTGASGFVGSAVARAAQARGADLRLLIRQSSPRANLEGLAAELAFGDMTDQAALASAMQGVRYLFHVAADYRLWARDPEEIVRHNLQGTTAVMEAALDLHLQRRDPWLLRGWPPFRREPAARA